MANLGQKATDGSLSFIEYVTNNKRFSEIDFEIESKLSTHLFIKKGK